MSQLTTTTYSCSCWLRTLDIYQYSAIGDAKSVLELLIALSLEGPC